jgi:hypothetical protein
MNNINASLFIIMVPLLVIKILRCRRQKDWQRVRTLKVPLSVVRGTHNGRHILTRIWSIQVGLVTWFIQLHLDWSRSRIGNSRMVASRLYGSPWLQVAIWLTTVDSHRKFFTLTWPTKVSCTWRLLLLFRWVCTSGSSSDLENTDRLAAEILEKIIAEGGKAWALLLLRYSFLVLDR